MDKETFENHLKTEHQSSPFSEYLEEGVYGGTDGIVTTFAVVAGFSGANLGEHTLNLSVITVLLFGVANLIADGAAMGLGNYLSVKSAKALYKNAYAKLTFLPSASKQAFPFPDVHWMVREVVDAFGPERCMFGSNFPQAMYSPQINYAQTVELFTDAIDLSRAEREWILGGTAAALWRWAT